MAAIIADPDEDTPRLALADWLEEHGDKHDRARAEFIRLQVEAARLPEWDKARATLEKEAAALSDAHHLKWLGPLSHFRVTDDLFQRGLMRVWAGSAGNF